MVIEPIFVTESFFTETRTQFKTQCEIAIVLGYNRWNPDPIAANPLRELMHRAAELIFLHGDRIKLIFFCGGPAPEGPRRSYPMKEYFGARLSAKYRLADGWLPNFGMQFERPRPPIWLSEDVLNQPQSTTVESAFRHALAILQANGFRLPPHALSTIFCDAEDADQCRLHAATVFGAEHPEIFTTTNFAADS